MKNEVRLETAEPENKEAEIRNEFLPLSEEVRVRSSKPKTDLKKIPQKLSVSEFNTAITHFYRGEISRSNVWRTRLDATTNWAVITAGATLSFVFSSPTNPAFAIPINSLLVAIFLFMEARRYRYYEVWANRVRVLETGYFAPMLSHQTIPPDKEWAEHISGDLLTPHFTITIWEAIGKRLRSNYLWIFVLLALSWGLKIYIHPFPIPYTTAAEQANFWNVMFSRAQVGIASGWFVISVGIIFNFLVFAFAIGTLKLRDASSEVLPSEDLEWHPLKQVSNWAGSNLKRRNTIRRVKRARQRIKSVQS
ncbi:MAG: DUF2270 domain-containing protein [Pyrinomonadaceae bacterium]|nr:DUF2270 domain-containing protein [Pyrinomonadaceae bacterium]